jgi:hypothetical protein
MARAFPGIVGAAAAAMLLQEDLFTHLTQEARRLVFAETAQFRRLCLRDSMRAVSIGAILQKHLRYGDVAAEEPRAWPA